MLLFYIACTLLLVLLSDFAFFRFLLVHCLVTLDIAVFSFFFFACILLRVR